MRTALRPLTVQQLVALRLPRMPDLAGARLVSALASSQHDVVGLVYAAAPDRYGMAWFERHADRSWTLRECYTAMGSAPHAGRFLVRRLTAHDAPRTH